MTLKAWVHGTVDGWMDLRTLLPARWGKVGGDELGLQQRLELVSLEAGDQTGCRWVDRLEDC